MAKQHSNTQRADHSEAATKKVLRIGIVQAGKLVEERIIRNRKTVTLGSSTRNTLVVPGLSRSFVMFPMKKDAYRLRFGQNTDGRVSHEGSVMTMDQLRQRGQCASAAGECLELPLAEGARGKIHMGDVTVLFQLVTPPPVRPQPQLPHFVRSSVLRDLDPVLACALVVMAVANFGFATFLHTLEFPEELKKVEEIPHWIPIPKMPVTLAPLALLGEKPLAKVVKVETARAQAEKPAKVDRAKTRRKPVKRRVARDPAAAPCDADCKAKKRRARLARLVRQYGVLSTIGHKGKKPGYMKDLLKPGSPGRELSKIKGSVVTSRSNVFDLNKQGTKAGPGKVVKIADLGEQISGPEEVKVRRMVKERVPKIILRKKPIKVDQGMSHTAAYWTIKRGMSCIQSGYERTLKHNPTAEGKMAVCLHVDARGKVARMTTKTDTVGDAKLTQRVRGCVMRLTFPPPEKGKARICVPFVLKRAGY